jgi:dUTPase
MIVFAVASCGTPGLDGIACVASPEPAWAEDLPETVRGAGGFGSTGAA